MPNVIGSKEAILMPAIEFSLCGNGVGEYGTGHFVSAVLDFVHGQLFSFCALAAKKKEDLGASWVLAAPIKVELA